ncbi:MAG TPA: acyl-CoA dehydrogenase family protein [Acidimicrobiia bacterium]|nr:acyl-CoA dehydrogenase family protein [Acidimicrobiia bacterium]
MHLAWGPEEERFRAELVAFIDEHAPPEARVRRDFADTDGGPGNEILPRWARDWQATLFDHGWMIPGYPPELGGRNCTPVQTLVYLEEMAALAMPRSFHFPGYAIVAPSLLEFGTEAQRALAPAAIRGDTVWCIGMSEPNAGSDLAALQTRAEVHDDHFVVTGQKVWTSYAMVAQQCFCYVRTDPSAPKHKGISLLIIDMSTPGIEIRPLRQFTGASDFAEVFFTDVVVPRDNLVGALNDGWRITQGSLAHERAGLWVEGVARLEHTLAGLVDLARRRGAAGDPIVRRRIAEGYQRASSLRALGYKGFTSYAQGSSAPEHSYMKMATAELGKALFELGTDLQGPYGAVSDAERAEEEGRWMRSFFITFAGTIAGGTSEIQRNIIAQRVLGLPRA